MKLDRDTFINRVLEGFTSSGPSEPAAGKKPGGIAAVRRARQQASPKTGGAAEAPFVQMLLREAGFGPGEALARSEVVLGDQKTNRVLPDAATYWAKSTERPFHILLFELAFSGKQILGDRLFRDLDQLEDALHRIVQDALEGFERGGAGRTAERKQGAQTQTLCVVSVLDDRPAIDGRTKKTDRQIVCFGTKCSTTDALEVFALREEVRDWDRPLAEEHLEQVFHRHFRKLGDGAKWQDAFVSGPERAKAEALLATCGQATLPDSQQHRLKQAIYDLLDQLAWSFGIPRRKARGNRCLEMEDLPTDHGIATDAGVARQAGFQNPFKGVRIFDSSGRLLGYIVYVIDNEEDLDRLRDDLKAHNHFHNVLVVYPGETGGTLELWQGAEPLRGRLTTGNRRSRFDGVGGV